MTVHTYQVKSICNDIYISLKISTNPFSFTDSSFYILCPSVWVMKSMLCWWQWFYIQQVRIQTLTGTLKKKVLFTRENQARIPFSTCFNKFYKCIFSYLIRHLPVFWTALVCMCLSVVFINSNFIFFCFECKPNISFCCSLTLKAFNWWNACWFL